MRGENIHRADRLERLLAEDAGTAELGIRVTIIDNVAHLRGQVNSAQRRDRVAEVVHAAEPGLVLRNEIDISLPEGTPHTEELS